MFQEAGGGGWWGWGCVTVPECAGKGLTQLSEHLAFGSLSSPVSMVT